MARIKLMNEAFLSSSSKQTTNCSVFFSLANEKLCIDFLSSTCNSQKITKFLSIYGDDEYSPCNYESVTKISVKKKRNKKPNTEKRVGFQITDKDLLFCKNPIFFRESFS